MIRVLDKFESGFELNFLTDSISIKFIEINFCVVFLLHFFEKLGLGSDFFLKLFNEQNVVFLSVTLNMHMFSLQFFQFCFDIRPVLLWLCYFIRHSFKFIVQLLLYLCINIVQSDKLMVFVMTWHHSAVWTYWFWTCLAKILQWNLVFRAFLLLFFVLLVPAIIKWAKPGLAQWLFTQF